jgi:hypothetical protein
VGAAGSLPAFPPSPGPSPTRGGGENHLARLSPLSRLREGVASPSEPGEGRAG